MSEQENMQATTKQRRSRKTTTVNQQNGKQASGTHRPTNDDKRAWRVYWQEKGQSWRFEPEIDAERQNYLSELRSITPDIAKGIYPFKDIKLNRADIEWLLATHENGRGPVDWSDVSQRGREGLDLRGADLREARLHSLPLARLLGSLGNEEWLEATEKQRAMAALLLERAFLIGTHLEGSHLRFARLEGVHLEFAYLERAHLRGADLKHADLREAFIQRVRLEDVVLCDHKGIGPRLADAKWEGVNLAVVKWSQVKMLADEYEALQEKGDGKLKDKITRLADYEVAVRAYRQFAVVLRNQGLNEDAARFTYRAQLMQQKVFWYQRNFGQYLFSLFLDLLAGYGYKPVRSFFAYLLVISVFATIYYLLGSHLAWNESLVISMTAFHGRGFFPDQFKPGDPQALVAAIEAFVGLLIEVTFIATLTQRLFGK